MPRFLIYLFIIAFSTLMALAAEAGELSFSWQKPPPMASEPFTFPIMPPNVTINAASMHFTSDTITLDSDVRAVRGCDLLTCGIAHLYLNPRRVHATRSPRLYRNETILEKRSTQEVTLDAVDILWNDASGTIDASSSVILRLEERTWDMASYSWAIISADAMTGEWNSQKLHFSGNVSVKAPNRFGRGRSLDYDKASSTAVLSGDAYVETEEWSEKEKKMVKRELVGQIIEYNLETKAASSQ